MASRPHFNNGIVELERLFAENGNDMEFLDQLAYELDHRKTDRAKALKERVRRARERSRAASADHATSARAEQSKTPGNAPLPLISAEEQIDKHEGPQAENDDQPQLDLGYDVEASVDASGLEDASVSYRAEAIDEVVPRPIPRRIGKPATNEAAEILKSWIALEVLSPQSYRRKSDLADGQTWRIAEIGNGPVPWELGEKAKPKTRLYYHVVIGAIRMAEASQKLLKAFGDVRAEFPPSRDFAALAVVTLDRQGRPASDDFVAISSFGWGYRWAAEGNLAALGNWPAAEAKLKAGLAKRLSRQNKEEELLPLNEADILGAQEWLVARLGLPSELVERTQFVVRTYQWMVIQEPPEPPLLNSFFIKDLAAARDMLSAGAAGAGLLRYLGAAVKDTATRPERIDLLKERNILDAALAPERLPPGRWPTRGGHALNLLQQAAVDLCHTTLGDGGIQGVNGPPGTGKTTLLRDIVAAIVVDRAEAMARLADPEEAFEHSGEKIKIGTAFCHLYRVSPAIAGREVVVASSNNKAVENISRELPGVHEIAEDFDLRYLQTVSDATAEAEGATWGFIAGVLGNAANRYAFRKAVWQEDDTSLKSYLAAAMGRSPKISETDPESKATIERSPRIVEREKPPTDRDNAMKAWRKAVKDFEAALKSVRADLKVIGAARKLDKALPSMEAEVAELEDRARSRRDELDTALRHADQTAETNDAAQAERQAAYSAVRAHDARRPGFWSRLFGTSVWRTWKQTAHTVAAELRIRSEAAEAAATALAASQRRVSESRQVLQAATDTADAKRHEYEKACASLAKAKSHIGEHFLDDRFWGRPYVERHQTVPWLPPIQQKKREKVFEAAMRLHHAFIDAAARPLRHNLMAYFQGLSGVNFSSPEKEALRRDLWSTLFLVCPVISTTFASVERMLGRLPPEGLGWLLIDEAGQATPQAAVGAIMRARRSVVVGDPRQIEPVVQLPTELVRSICKDFGVDPDIWAAPFASAQGVADAGSDFGQEQEQDQGSIWIGAPLLVHRRCQEPMFGISNRIAYDDLMVQASPMRRSRIVDALGPSRWIDVAGIGRTKWCPEEGDRVQDLLRLLADRGLDDPDIFIISPFRDVAHGLRGLLTQPSSPVQGWSDKPWAWASERVGTVHTFQGKQADTVIFVLGAPNPAQKGARTWAGAHPNLLNVAVSRAQNGFYVVGSRSLWRGHGTFATLDAMLNAERS